MRELERAQKWISNRFARLADASAMVVAYIFRGLDETTSTYDGLSASFITLIINRPGFS